MPRALSEKIAALPTARRKKIEERARELIAQEMSLRELRKATGKTQAKIAAALGVGQDSVVRYEQRTDPNESAATFSRKPFQRARTKPRRSK